MKVSLCLLLSLNFWSLVVPISANQYDDELFNYYNPSFVTQILTRNLSVYSNSLIDVINDVKFKLGHLSINTYPSYSVPLPHTVRYF